jgi:hypothetical protein
MRKLSFLEKSYLLLLLAFIVSRFFYYWETSLEFHSKTLTFYLQYLDLTLLRTDLLRSLFYLQQQPPLFNLFLGIVLKIFPVQYALAFQSIYIIFGIIFMFALLQLMLEMGVEKRIAVGLTLIHAIHPTVVRYENYLFYSYPLAMLMTLIALFCLRYAKKPTLSNGAWFFASVAVLILTRQIFTVGMFLIFLAAALFFLPRSRQTTMKAAWLPLVILFSYAVKQYYLFGTTTTGSVYMGCNLGNKEGKLIPLEKQQSLTEKLKLQPYFFYSTFSNMNKFAPYITSQTEFTHPALASPFKENGEANWNYYGYLQLAEGYKQGFIDVLLYDPLYYIQSVGQALVGYFKPASTDRNLTPVTHRFGMVGRFFDIICGGKFTLRSPAYFLWLAFPSLIIFGLRELFKFIRLDSNLKSVDVRARALGLSFMLFSIFFMGAVTLLISMSDFARYRTKVDAFYVVLLGLAATSAWEYWRKKTGRAV